MTQTRGFSKDSLADLPRLIKECPDGEKVIIFDMLSGYGFSSLFLADTIKRNDDLKKLKIVLIDCDVPPLEGARKYFISAFPKLRKHIDFVASDVNELGFRDNSVSLILLNDYCLLNHMTSKEVSYSTIHAGGVRLHVGVGSTLAPLPAFKELPRILKPGGRIIVGAKSDPSHVFKDFGFTILAKKDLHMSPKLVTEVLRPFLKQAAESRLMHSRGLSEIISYKPDATLNYSIFVAVPK